jgi:hypothetical protein
LCLCGSSFSADDPAKDKEEPPVRLKKKVKPDQPPAAEKKQESPPRKIEEPAKKPGEGKDEPEVDPKELEEKIKELMDRVGKNMREADDRLARKDTGDATQQVERDIVKDLDELIEQTKRQQQQQQQQQSQSQGGGSQSAEQQRQQRRQQARATRQRRRQMGQRQNAMNQPDQQTGNNAQGGNGTRGEMSKIADLYKDIWGHLPETMRQEMNQYSREQFMAKYHELLKQYYSTIAEKGRRKGEGN